MADIRTTGILDDFERANETPIASPWVKADSAAWAANGNLSAGKFVGAAGDSKYALTTEAYSGNDIEVWGYPWSTADITEGWRLALLKDVGGSGACDGYSMRFTIGIGGNGLTINRLTNGAFTLIFSDSNVGFPDDDAILLRTTATDVEVWMAAAPYTSWSMIGSAADTTYRTGLYPCIGNSSDDGTGPGWLGIGGGAPQGITRLPQIIRRTPRLNKYGQSGRIWLP